MFSFKRNDERFVRAILNPNYRLDLLPRLEQGRTFLFFLLLIMAIVSYSSQTASSTIVLLAILAIFLVSDLSIKLFKLFDTINLSVPDKIKATPDQVARDLKEQRREGLVAALIALAITVILIHLRPLVP